MSDLVVDSFIPMLVALGIVTTFIVLTSFYKTGCFGKY